MKSTRIFVTLSFCLSLSLLHAQEETARKKGIFSFGATLSDYNFVKYATDSSFKYAMSNGHLLKPGNASFGFQLSYWQHFKPHINFSCTVGTDFSNFPALFVKGDSIGQAGLSAHFSGLAHIMAFSNEAKVNPFLSLGLGAGLFGNQLALFSPVGTGLAFRFNGGSILTLQLQLRKALSSGITNDFIMYSMGVARDIRGKSPKNYKNSYDELTRNSLPTREKIKDRKGKIKKRSTEKGSPKDIDQVGTDTMSLKTIGKSVTVKVVEESKMIPLPDTDGDNVPDKNDKCPALNGTVENEGCPLPLVEGADVLNMSADSATYSIQFDFDRSLLPTGVFGILNNIVEILRKDKTLSLNITGHADNQGTDFKNMKVSEERANVTRNYFLSYNIAPSRIRSSYYGASRPIDTVQQWRNRRVEVTIIKN